MNKYRKIKHRVAKLLSQYETHGSLIIGVDFDFTLYSEENGLDTKLIALLIKLQRVFKRGALSSRIIEF